MIDDWVGSIPRFPDKSFDSHVSYRLSQTLTKNAYNFVADQEAHRKDIERGFIVLKIKFLALTHPINLHHCDDIYYLVLGAILQHNMMVEARLENGKEESSAMYNTVELTAEESGNVGCGDNLSGEDSETDMEVDESMLRQFWF